MKTRIVLFIAVFCAAGLCPTVSRTASVSMQEAKASRIVEAARAVYEYRLRGEVRLLIFWLGKDNVGGGHVSTSRKAGAAPNSWYEEFEILFGSDPSRVPKGINRWGYGREIAQWFQEDVNSVPRLVATEFQGIMRHSEESSLNEALDSTKKASDAGQFLYDATLSRVNPASSTNESRILTEKEEFNYRYPESLLAKYRESLANDPPRKRGELANASGLYDAPYGFLSGLCQLIRRVREGDSQPSLTYIYNSRPYMLRVQSVRSVSNSQLRGEWKSSGVQNVSKVRFRCFNTFKKTQTDFELWLPRAGAFKDIPVRILHQPRWWLRLQLDLDIPKSQQP